jgi:hypothetical protein
VCHADSRTVPYSWRSRLSTLDRRLLGGWLQTDCLAGWLTDSSLANHWLTLRNSCLKVGMCGRYSPPHRSYTQCMNLVIEETSVVYFTWVANRCYGYEIRNQLSVEWQRHRFPGIRLHRQQRRYIRLLDSSDNLRNGSPSQYYEWKGIMKYALEMGLGGKIYISSSIKTVRAFT